MIGTLTAQEYGWRTMRFGSVTAFRARCCSGKIYGRLAAALLWCWLPCGWGGDNGRFHQNLQGSLPFAQ
ncbi:MAG: hypothetical protein H6656_07875 [Ardenticatenaceae bacterium]|nr:hypothetical protein [Ardenticatenaceae bacterium]